LQTCAVIRAKARFQAGRARRSQSLESRFRGNDKTDDSGDFLLQDGPVAVGSPRAMSPLGSRSIRKDRSLKSGLNVLGGFLLVIGLVWALQGMNVLLGSFMSGQPKWLYIGIVVAIAGAALLGWNNLRGRL
jgi:hypothetical protein